jgi:hypothetical protein
MRLRQKSNFATKFVLLGTSLASIILVTLTGIIDELNGLHFFLLDDVHIFLSLSFFVVNVAWAYLFLDEYSQLELSS